MRHAVGYFRPNTRWITNTKGRQLRRLFASAGKPDDKAVKLPNFHIVPINEPERLIGRFLIVGAFDDFGRSRNMIIAVYEIDAVRGHGATVGDGRLYETAPRSRVPKDGV